MSTFETTVTIQARPEIVWATLSDIGNIYRWNPGVRASHLTSDLADGIGTSRFCDLGGDNYLDEQVVAWEPNERLTMRVTGTNLPFKTIDIRFRMVPHANGGTLVICSPIYTVKYGPLGRLLDRFYVRRTYQTGMEQLLAGLKDFVENGEDVLRLGNELGRNWAIGQGRQGSQ